MRRKHRKHVFIQNKFQNIFFLREYRRERSEFDVGPGLKFINIYIQVELYVKLCKFKCRSFFIYEKNSSDYINKG